MCSFLSAQVVWIFCLSKYFKIWIICTIQNWAFWHCQKLFKLVHNFLLNIFPLVLILSEPVLNCEQTSSSPASTAVVRRNGKWNGSFHSQSGKCFALSFSRYFSRQGLKIVLQSSCIPLADLFCWWLDWFPYFELHQ